MTWPSLEPTRLESSEKIICYIFFRFLHSIQERIRKTFRTSDEHVGNGVIAIGLRLHSIPFVRELMHDSASLRVLHKDGSCSRYGADVGCGKI